MASKVSGFTLGVSLVGAAFVSLMQIQVAHAQQEQQEQQEQQAGKFEEIVVTARGRKESLQDLPLSVTAFTESDIQSADLANLEDISQQSPGMQFNSNLSGAVPGRLYSNIRFRGVAGPSFGAQSTAGFFIDGIYALQGAQSMALLDVERIEVIKGPQSAIFGRSSFAGAINYITKTPDFQEFHGAISADAGEYNRSSFMAAAEGPIIGDRLAFRVGLQQTQKGPQWTASDGGGLGAESSEAVFGTLYYEPTERLSFRFRAYYQEDDDGQPAVAFLQGRLNDTCTGTTVPGFDEDGNPTTLSPTGTWCGSVPQPGDPASPEVDANTSLFPQYESFQGGFERMLIDDLLNQGGIPDVPKMDSLGTKREMTRLSLEVQYLFDNDIAVTAHVAHNEVLASHVRDYDNHPQETWWVDQPQNGVDKTFDIRARSAGDRRFRWLAGFNYYEQEYVTPSTATNALHICANFAGLASGNFCDFPGVFSLAVDGGDFIDVWSVYASVSYDLTDQITLDLEGRYQQDERADGLTELKETYEDFAPRVTLTYRPTDNVTLYVVATQGVLPGTINSTFANCQNIVFTVPFIDNVTGELSFSTECEQWHEQLGDLAQESIGSQTLDSIEIGARTSWFNDRIIANVSLYTQKWSEQPFTQSVWIFRSTNGDTIPDDNPFFRHLGVPGDSKFRGVEFESVVQVTDTWSMKFSGSYNENEFTNFHLPEGQGAALSLGTTNIKGNRASKFPKWSGSLASTYHHQLEGPWQLYVRGDVLYHGKTVTGTTNLSTLDDYFLVNARVGVEQDNFSLEFYARNLLNQDKWRVGQEATDFTFFGAGFDFSKRAILLMPQDLRTFGVRANYRF